jgi:hypothetical protein
MRPVRIEFMGRHQVFIVKVAEPAACQLVPKIRVNRERFD